MMPFGTRRRSMMVRKRLRKRGATLRHPGAGEADAGVSFSKLC